MTKLAFRYTLLVIASASFAKRSIWNRRLFAAANVVPPRNDENSRRPTLRHRKRFFNEAILVKSKKVK
jgi:hypothetical protein